MFNASAFNGMRNPFSPGFWQKLRDLAQAMSEVYAVKDQWEAMIRAREVMFPAVITGSTPVAGKPAWTYTFTEIRATAIKTAVALQSPQPGAEFDLYPVGFNPRTGEAINVAESANAAGAGAPTPFFYGNPVGVGGPPWYFAATPFNCSRFDPIPNGVIVFMRTAHVATSGNTSFRFEFWAPNPVIPACCP